MSIYKQFKTSKIHEEEGILVRFKANSDGTFPTFRIGRACRSNVKWQKTFEAKTRPFKKEIDEKIISEIDANRINVEIFASSLLLGWEHVKDEKEKNITFSYEAAVKLLTDLPDLYEILNEKASDMKNFLAADLKEDEKLIEVFLYDLEIGSKEENLIKQSRRMNQPIPERIKNKPILKTGLALYFDAFLELQFDRTESGYVPWSVIVKFVDRYELTDIQEENLIYFIRSLDRVYNKWKSKK